MEEGKGRPNLHTYIKMIIRLYEQASDKRKHLQTLILCRMQTPDGSICMKKVLREIGGRVVGASYNVLITSLDIIEI